MNEDLIARIDKATVSHALCKTRLLEASRGKMLGLGSSLDGDGCDCEFGRWMDSNRSRLGDHPEFQEVYSGHELFHMDVADSLDSIRRGGGAKVEREILFDGAFRRNANRFIHELIRWRDRLSR